MKQKAINAIESARKQAVRKLCTSGEDAARRKWSNLRFESYRKGILTMAELNTLPNTLDHA